jgi:hypothetical protein
MDETQAPIDLNGPQIIAIMDQLAVMEASWHAGHSLAQTVYTCHYLLHQKRYIRPSIHGTLSVYAVKHASSQGTQRIGAWAKCGGGGGVLH